MIKIIKSKTELSEDRLNQLDAQGLTLISANCAVTNEYMEGVGIGLSIKHDVTRWTYHFRSAARKFSSPSPYDAGARSLTRRDKKGRPW